jgi:hypothetical protein
MLYIVVLLLAVSHTQAFFWGQPVSRTFLVLLYKCCGASYKPYGRSFEWKKIMNYSRLAVKTLIVPPFPAVTDSTSLASVLVNSTLSLENAVPLGLVSVRNAWSTGTAADLIRFVTTQD